jgi:hypothetical protein
MLHNLFLSLHENNIIISPKSCSKINQTLHYATYVANEADKHGDRGPRVSDWNMLRGTEYDDGSGWSIYDEADYCGGIVVPFTANGFVARGYANQAGNQYVRNWEKKQREEEKLRQGTVEIGPITYGAYEIGKRAILDISIAGGAAILGQGINSSIGLAIDLKTGDAKGYMNQGDAFGLGGGWGLNVSLYADNLNYITLQRQPGIYDDHFNLNGATLGTKFGLWGVGIQGEGLSVSVGPGAGSFVTTTNKQVVSPLMPFAEWYAHFVMVIP